MRTGEPLKGGAEYDAFTRWRRSLHWHKGELAKVKQRHHQRVRRKTRRELRDRNDQ